MLPPPFENALVLTGPTGSGKSQLGVELAQRLNAEIVSMDSMALYRGMDIGTAKPTQAECALTPHHLLDVREPWESASVAWWLEQAKRCCREIEARGKQVLFVGGTPLYLKALLCGLFEGPPADATIRRRLREEVEAQGAGALHERLAAVDAVSAERIHPNDTRRTIRALEVHELTGKRMSEWQTQWPGVRSQGSGVRGQESGVTSEFCSPTPVVWLDLPRDELYARIDRRVEEMFAAGLVDEARQLRALEKPLSLEASKALGYQEVFDLLDGKASLADTVARVRLRSRNLAKRQITWFRHLPNCHAASKELTWTLWQVKMNR